MFPATPRVVCISLPTHDINTLSQTTTTHSISRSASLSSILPNMGTYATVDIASDLTDALTRKKKKKSIVTMATYPGKALYPVKLEEDFFFFFFLQEYIFWQDLSPRGDCNLCGL